MHLSWIRLTQICREASLSDRLNARRAFGSSPRLINKYPIASAPSPKLDREIRRRDDVRPIEAHAAIQPPLDLLNGHGIRQIRPLSEKLREPGDTVQAVGRGEDLNGRVDGRVRDEAPQFPP